MKSFRTLAAAGVVGALTLGSGLFADFFGMSDAEVCGQTLVARAPSTLSSSSNYAPAYSYAQQQGFATLPGYYSAPGFAPGANFTAKPFPASYGYAAFPANAYVNPYAQPAPYQVPYQPSNAQPSWPYTQTNDGQASVMLGRSELLGGPPLSSPQIQLPAPAPQSPHQHMPLQQAPHAMVPIQPMPSQQLQMQPVPGYGFDAYSYGGGSCDVWPGGYAAIQAQPAIRNWFGSFGAIVMTRDRGDHYTFSYGTGNEADQRTDTRNASMNWSVGYEIRFGRYFNCQRNAIEAVYWNLNPTSASTQTVSANVLGNLNAILNWDSLTYGGNTADIYVNVAPGDDGIHHLTRAYSFQNLELNLWQFCGSCSADKCGCSRLRHNWFMGVRYFRFDEGLLFASDANDTQITHENDEIFYNIDIENHLFGFQVGNEAQYCVSNRLSADFGIKLGIFSNQINHISEIGGNLGIATINNGPFLGEEYYVSSSKNDVAFLGEMNLGVRYCFNCNWTGTVGYRALAITGVALASDQIYPDLRGINDVANIDSSRGLILHGGYAGLEYNW
ncbi:MAG: BBP7 family outer membrane beta-barrel protein [Planctomycetaceae bacterium]|nr:BBP7 family outer membrane beta-barrel protein [Planctomycetales bacterium]MCB9926757.1 BBP7 family outer membrane beta-barrel protein [Planctomycetaceae bacterium]